MVSTFEKDDPDALILLTPVDDPQSYGVAELDGEGGIVRLIEKPKDPPSNLALVGVYLFSQLIFDAARRLEPSWRGELEITEAIQTLIDDGRTVQSEVVRGWWKDTGQLADMLEANRLVLEEIEESSRGRGRRGVAGRRPRDRLPGRQDRPLDRPRPRRDRPRRDVEDAFIGPYTSIGDEVAVRRCEVEHSIVLANSTVEDLGTRMEASLLGRNVKLTRSDGLPKTLRLLVGDNSVIEIQ